MKKLTVNDYKNIIKDLKQQAHNNNQLYIELITNDLMLDNESAGKNVRVVSTALSDELLEGDKILGSRVGRKDFTVRFYCDNLSSDRKAYNQVI
jgi:hypothetical protein